MKRMLILMILSLLVLPSALAIGLTIEKESSSEVMIAGLNNSAVFNLKITNLGLSDSFQIYNLVGFDMAPKLVSIMDGETKDVRLEIFPMDDFKFKNVPYFLEYYVKGQRDTTRISDKIVIKMMDLGKVFEVGAAEFSPDSNSLNVFIANKENFNFNELNAKFKSPFFTLEKSFSLGPNERKTFSVELNREDFKKLMAGFYTLTAELSFKGVEADVEGTMNFVEKDILTTEESDFGFVVYTKNIEKKNEGNVLTKTEVVVKKNIFSRLFTRLSPTPDAVERDGWTVFYTWDRAVKPGESLEVVVKTNWLFPFLIALFVIVIVVLARQYSRTNLVMRKKVSFVRAKGGEFALKVSIFIHAKKYLEAVSIIDRLPPLVKLHSRFGEKEPFRVDDKNRKIEWNFEKLEAGEVRTLSYIIYSKVGVLGRFALPSATGLYEINGQVRESSSNKAFFVAEQKGKEEGFGFSE